MLQHDAYCFSLAADVLQLVRQQLDTKVAAPIPGNRKAFSKNTKVSSNLKCTTSLLGILFTPGKELTIAFFNIKFYCTYFAQPHFNCEDLKILTTECSTQ